MDCKDSYRGCQDRRIQNQPGYLNDTVPRFCQECAQYVSCDLCHDEQLREQCLQLQEDIPLFYKNSEGYSDPTSFFALRNVERERKTKREREREHNTMQTRNVSGNRDNNSVQTHIVTSKRESGQSYSHRVQVIHF